MIQKYQEGLYNVGGYCIIKVKEDQICQTFYR